MLKGKIIYKSNINGDLTIEEQIEQVKLDSLRGGWTDKNFSESLKYDITRTVANIFGNSVITYDGRVDPFCESLQRNLLKIYFMLHDNGRCFLKLGNDQRIEEVTNNKGTIELIDFAYDISNITQKKAAAKSLEMYGIVTNVMYSVLDERGMLGVFSPEKGEVVKAGQVQNLYTAFKDLFGVKKGQKKFAITEIPMKYSGVSIPVAELQLLENERAATAKVARLYGIQEDMILSGSTFDNKENAIIQTYTDFKGLIYNYITQIESESLASFRVMDKYNVTFPGVPQMNKPTITTGQ
jgi:hypothetical protein